MLLLKVELVNKYKSLRPIAKREIRSLFRNENDYKSDSRFERLMRREEPALPREFEFLNQQVMKHLIDQD